MVQVQLYHFGSGRRWDDHQCGINLSIVADEWADSAGLVGNRRFVDSTLHFLVCVKPQVLTRSDYFCCVALGQIAMEEPFSLGETPLVRTLTGEIENELPDSDQRSRYCTPLDLFSFFWSAEWNKGR